MDAHVGKAVFHNVFKNALYGKTRVLVTHALHFLPHVDYIITIQDGRIVERGTYKELVDNKGAFAKFVSEFGAKEESEEKNDEPSADNSKMKKGMAGGQIMQAEERSTGAVSNAGRLRTTKFVDCTSFAFYSLQSLFRCCKRGDFTTDFVCFFGYLARITGHEFILVRIFILVFSVIESSW